MKQTIYTDQTLCEGCNRCVRECPMELASITYQDEEGNIKVKVDDLKCIACGRCISVCPHNARRYYDDTEQFFDDLSKGVPISLIAAPSVKANIPDYRRLFTYLKNLGVKKIYDVSLGADICIWASIRYIDKNKRKPVIAQPCPAVVSYCEIYRQDDLLKNLLPIHSAMGCLAIYMKEHEGIQDRIAALSPCIAKSNEFDSTGLTQYNVTFLKLREYLEANNIELPSEETGFDHPMSGIGCLFPTAGGFKEDIEFYMGKDLQISKAEGFDVYEDLCAYAETPEELLPAVFDVLSCHNGCNMGPACSPVKSMFEIDRSMHNNWETAVAGRDREYFESIHAMYDETLDPARFTREYCPVSSPSPQITDEDIQRAFELLDKDDDKKQNIDGGACGSGTCLNMARKVALGVNIPSNCVMKTIDQANAENIKSLSVLKQFETIWGHVESGTAIIDAETREILDVNPAAVRIFGGLRQDMIGNQCQNVFCPAEQCPILDLGQVVDRSERKLVKAGGNVIPIIKSVAKIDYYGRPALLESFADISYIKDSEEQNNRLKLAEQANKAKSAFLANMSHEIRTPMNSIVGFSELAIEEAQSPKTKDYLNKIVENTEWLLQIINDILDISKIESGNMVLDNIPFDLHEILATCKGIIMPKAAEKSIELHFSEPSIKKKLYGDPRRIRQVLINLLSNAVKFTDTGSVSLMAAIENSVDDILTLRVEVKDSGIGMTPEQISKVFDPFTQGDVSRTRKYGGTGLGLTIVKNILELMGSRLEIESAPGAGTSISFTINVSIADAADEMPESGDAFGKLEKPAFKGVVLVCEDNKMNQRVIREHLEKTGLHVQIAENGLEGLEMVEHRIEIGEKPYDLILMDIHMPIMDGIEAAPKIIALGSGAPVVAMTANIMDEDRDLYKTLGMDDYVGKPFTSQELWHCLLKYLKPIGSAGADGYDEELQNLLKADFIRSNKNIFEEIEEAIDAGDITLAHRLAHNLKSNAGLIGKASLQKAAADVEGMLKAGVLLIPEAQTVLLRSELMQVLDELAPYAGEKVVGPQTTEVIDGARALALLEKLEPLLKSGSPECLNLLDELRAVPGSKELVDEIDDFYFSAAVKTLEALKTKFDQL